MCGVAEKYIDSAKSPNRNDNGVWPMYARVDPQCWSTQWNGTNSAAHELMHSLGAVQPDAPSASRFGHCTDESDAMCYDDDSEHPVRQVCPVDQESLFDCGDDDYFNPGAGLDPGSYLGTHWNTADSSYLTSAPVLPTSPVITGPAQILAGESAVFTASHPGITTFQWVVQSAGGCTADPLAGPSTTVSCPITAPAGPVKVMVTGTAADGQLAEALRLSAVYLSSLPTAAVAGPDLLRGGTTGTYTLTADPVLTELTNVGWVLSPFCSAPSGVTTGLQVTIRCQPNLNGVGMLSVSGYDKFQRLVRGSKVITLESAPALLVQLAGPQVLSGQPGTYTVSASNQVGSVQWAASAPECTLTPSASGTEAVMDCGGRQIAQVILTATVTDGYGQVWSQPLYVMSQPPLLLTATIAGPTTLTTYAGSYMVTATTPVQSVAWMSSSTACVITNPATAAVTVKCTNWNGALTLTVTVTDVYGHVVTKTTPVTVMSQVGFTGKAPTRVLDTRFGVGALKAKLGAGRTLTLTVPGLPAGTTAVALNVTVVHPTAASYLSVYPGDAAKPTASNLNFVAGQAIANMVVVPVGPGNTVTFYNGVGAVNVIADLVGYYKPGTGAGFTGQAPTRVLDTRYAVGAPMAKLGAGGTLTLTVPDLPAGTTAVALNVMANNPTATSYLSVYPGGTALPTASNLNFVAGRTIANMVLVPVGPGNTVTFYNGVGAVNVIADLVGYYQPGTGAGFTGMDPTRVLDTRTGVGAPTTAKLGAGGTLTLTVPDLPAGTTAVALNVTVVHPTANGYLTVYPGDTAKPTASNLNFVAGQAIANLVLVPVGPGNTVTFYNAVGAVNVLADLVGSYS